MKEVPGQSTQEELDTEPYRHPFVLLFDREGYSPEFFREMWQNHRIACVTYHKYLDQVDAKTFRCVFLGCRKALSTRSGPSQYQQRKREEVQHPLLKENVAVGLLPHLQARLLARTIRGELAEYPALVLK